MSKTIQIVAIVVLLAAAVVLYVTRSRSTEGAGSRTDFDTVVRCRACNESYQTNVESSATEPYACEKCGKKDAWRLQMCRQCKELFLPEVSGDPPRPPAIASCPKCGSQSTGAAPVNAGGT